MTLRISFQKTPPARADTAAAFIYKGGKLDSGAERLDRETGGLVRYHMKRQKRFAGKKGQMLALTLAKGAPYARLILVGLDDPAKPDAASYEAAGGRLYAALAAAGAVSAVLYAGVDRRAKDSADPAAHVAMGLRLRSYGFEKYKSKKKDDAKTEKLRGFTVAGARADSKAAFEALDKAAAGVFFARDLSNEPPNVLYPDSFARRVRRELAPLGVKVEVIDHRRMEELGFGAHLAVGQGSARPPRVVLMRWNGAPGKKNSKNRKPPVAFVGKGVTFDTGGISIKPGANMDEMKHDMSGAAAVAGVMMTLALRRAKVDVIGVAGLAENMPSDRAYRPGDIITSLSGKTIEVLNTDAEGRLVLCDSLTYVQKKYKPRVVVNLATLTGAIVVALGSEYAGTFANSDDLWKKLDAAARAGGEKLWRMPLDEAYRKEMDSHVADLRNIGAGRDAGSCTAAGFLQRFIEDGRPWAHIDIAGTAWIKGDKPVCVRGGTGFGVRLLDNLVAEHYES